MSQSKSFQQSIRIILAVPLTVLHHADERNQPWHLWRIRSPIRSIKETQQASQRTKLSFTSFSKYYLEGRDTEGMQCDNLYLKLPINASNKRGFVRELGNGAAVSVAKLQVGIWNRKKLFAIYDSRGRPGENKLPCPHKHCLAAGDIYRPYNPKGNRSWQDPAVDAPAQPRCNADVQLMLAAGMAYLVQKDPLSFCAPFYHRRAPLCICLCPVQSAH